MNKISQREPQPYLKFQVLKATFNAMGKQTDRPKTFGFVYSQNGPFLVVNKPDKKQETVNLDEYVYELDKDNKIIVLMYPIKDRSFYESQL